MCPLALFTVLLLIADFTNGQTEVETTHGPVVGTEDTYSGETVRRFRGIPFAKPPTGKRRFLPPEEPDKWTEPLDTKEYSPQCYQSGVFFTPVNMTSMYDEDCLYLNVFAPKGGSNLPVMVWIHGGGLRSGSASQYDPETLAVSGNVVMVTINYRLDIFGFFSTGNDIVEGNTALLDQVMALSWVKNNIRNFGGNSEKVTIIGHSAGSWSVNLHMISPLSKGLFLRAISQAGSMYGNNLPRKEEYHTKTKLLATLLNCPNTEVSIEVLECLQSVPPSDLLRAASHPTVDYRPNVLVGNRFLPNDPTSMWDKGDINAADYIIGFNSEEGALPVQITANRTRLEEYLHIGISADNPDFIALSMMALSKLDSNATVSPTDPLWRILSDQYLLDFTDPIQNMRGLLNMLADAFCIGPSINNARAMEGKSGSKVYLFYFDQVLNNTKDLPPGHMADDLAISGSKEMGIRAGHGAEMPYIFGYISENFKDMPSNIYDYVSEADRNVGKSIMNAWVTFASTGQPKVLVNLEDRTTEIDWPTYDPITREYAMFKHLMSEDNIRSRLLPNRISFFTEILPKILQETTGNGTKCEGTPSNGNQIVTQEALFIFVIAMMTMLTK